MIVPRGVNRLVSALVRRGQLRRWLSSEEEGEVVRQLLAGCRREVDAQQLLRNFPPASLSISRIVELSQVLKEASLVTEDVLGELLKEAGKKLEGTHPEASLKLLQTCSRLGFTQKDPLSEFLQACDVTGVFSQTSGLSPNGVAALLGCLAQLHKQGLSIAPEAHKIIHGLRFYLRSMILDGRLHQEQISRVIFAMGVLQYRDRALMMPLLQFIESPSALRGLSHRAVASLVYGLSQLQSLDYYSLQPLTHLILYEMGLEAFSNIDIASLLLSAVKLGWRNDDLDQQLAKEACLWRRLGHYNVKTFSSVCLSLGRLSQRDSAHVQRLVAYLKQPLRVEQLDSQGLANVAQGLQLMGVQDEELWTGLCDAALRPSRLKCFTEQGLATVVHSLSSHIKQQAIWKSLMREILGKRDLASWKESSLMTLLMGVQHQTEIYLPVIQAVFLEITQPERLQKLSEKNLLGAFVCLCRLKWQNRKFPTAIGRLLLYEILDSSRFDLSPQTIALTIYSVGTLKSVRLASLQELTGLIQKAVEPKMSAGFTPQGWAILIFGLGELRFQDWKILDRLVAGVFRKGVSHFSTFELCDVFFGLGKCGYAKSTAVQGLMSEILREERTHEMVPSVLTTLLLAFAYHKLQDEALVQTVLERVLDPVMLPEFTKKQLSTILQSLSLLQCASEAAVDQIVHRAIPVGLNPNWDEEGKEQIPWLIHSLARLRIRKNEIWVSLLEEVRRGDYRLLSTMSPAALSSVLYALKDIRSGAEDIKQRLIEKLLVEECIDNGSLLKAFEALVETGEVEAAEKVLMVMMRKRRVKHFSGSAMARLAECLFQTRLLTQSPYGNWFLTELLYFKDGLLFSRFSDAHLLYLVTSLKSFIQQNYPYLPQLLEALKNEIYSLQRRDSLSMGEMLRAVSELKSVEARCQPSP